MGTRHFQRNLSGLNAVRRPGPPRLIAFAATNGWGLRVAADIRRNGRKANEEGLRRFNALFRTKRVEWDFSLT